jgi:hypothetical protein
MGSADLVVEASAECPAALSSPGTSPDEIRSHTQSPADVAATAGAAVFAASALAPSADDDWALSASTVFRSAASAGRAPLPHSMSENSAELSEMLRSPSETMLTPAEAEPGMNWARLEGARPPVKPVMQSKAMLKKRKIDEILSGKMEASSSSWDAWQSLVNLGDAGKQSAPQ